MPVKYFSNGSIGKVAKWYFSYQNPNLGIIWKAFDD
jgi:hypothetical protein